MLKVRCRRDRISTQIWSLSICSSAPGTWVVCGPTRQSTSPPGFSQSRILSSRTLLSLASKNWLRPSSWVVATLRRQSNSGTSSCSKPWESEVAGKITCRYRTRTSAAYPSHYLLSDSTVSKSLISQHPRWSLVCQPSSVARVRLLSASCSRIPPSALLIAIWIQATVLLIAKSVANR